MSLNPRHLSVFLGLALLVPLPCRPQAVLGLDLTVSGSSVRAGEPITLTARTALTEGRIAYYDGAYILGYADLSRTGRAELVTRALTPGAHFIRALVVSHQDIAARGRTVTILAGAIAKGTWEAIRVSAGNVLVGSQVVFEGGAQAVTTGDFDEDGHLDLLVATTAGLVVLAGDGAHEFASPVWTIKFDQPATKIEGLVCADFNEDGHSDIAFGLDGGTSIYFGDGKSSFGPAVRYRDGVLPAGTPLGDLNGDGHVDLLAIDSRGQLRVLLGTGRGIFYPQPLELPGLIPSSAGVGAGLEDSAGRGVVDSISVGTQRWRRDLRSGLFAPSPSEAADKERVTVALTSVLPGAASLNKSNPEKPAATLSPEPIPHLSSTVTKASGGTGVVYTCDPAILAVPGVCNTLNTTIAALYSSAFTNANASIYITFGSTGLGASLTALNIVGYSTFRTALIASETSANDVTAVNSSVPPSNPFGSNGMTLTNANVRALGITPAPNFGLKPNGGPCVLGTNDCYDGLITISSSLQSSGGLFFRSGSITSGQYDFYSAVQHETDEVLGTPSCALGGAACVSVFDPPDLFRYHSDGTRSFAGGNNSSCASPSNANACFSIDGVHMLQQYNNLSNGEDGGDWAPNCVTPRVQNSEACPGAAGVDLSAIEIEVLDVIGFSTPLPAFSISKSHAGSFTQGQTGATYTLTIANTGTAATAGTVTVTDTVPAGLTLVSMNGGATWNCSALPTCTTSSVLSSGSNYPVITVTVDVAANASSPQVNAAGVTGGGALPANTTDSTTVLAPPAAPTLLSPANGAAGVSLTPSLSWSASSGATSYDVYFGASSNPPFVTNTAGTTYAPGTLSSATPYFWRVVAKNSDGSATSAVWSFTTQPAAMFTKVGVFRSGFYWLEDVDGNRQFTIPPDHAFAFGGIPGDIPITGDWNGSGHTRAGVYRPSNGLFILDTNGDEQFDAGDAVYNLGLGVQPGDLPVMGDWNGDGRTKIGLFRQGFFWILDYNGNGVFDAGTDKTYAFGGVAGDVPVVGDWNGSGSSKIGLFRQGFFWILDYNGNGSLDNVNQGGGDKAFAYGGISGDVPLVGDWNGDGKSKVGVFRGGFFWVLDATGNNSFDGTGPGQDLAFAFGGISGDKPVIGKW